MDPKNFLAELKRRNVYRVAVAYAIIAWLLVQIATQTFPFFAIPNWGVRLVIFLIVLGFPVALVFAWVFELTPEGLKRTEDIAPHESITKRTGQKLDFLIIAVLVGAIVFLLLTRTRPASRPAGGVPEKSIAVLPFENLSDEKENAFFADGIQDDILTSLAKIRDLKVTSRTSVMGFRGKETRNLREIGKTLGVAHILQGSVRRDGNRVKVSAQLLDARTDDHLWAENYDRTLSDVLTLQAELATVIAGRLKATLSPAEKANVSRKPTLNPDAYVLYLRGRQAEFHPDTQFENFKAAVQFYEEAIELDPNFALAHARLAAASARIYHFFEPTKLWKQRAKVEAVESLRLEPFLGEGHFALGLVLYWLEGDYARALREFAAGQALLPNDTEIGSMTAAVARREGRWEDALLAYQRIAEIDPQNPNILRNLVFTFGALRKWPEAVGAAERWTALAATSIDARMQGAYMTFLWKGDTSALEACLNSSPPGVDPEGALTGARWDVSMIKRDFAGAEAALAASPLNELAYLKGGFAAPKSFFAGCTALARGDQSRAEAAFEEARSSFERAVQAAPESATRHANLGLLLAFMGRKDEAIAAGRRAVALKPEAKDAVDGPHLSGYLALIYTRVGEHELALPLLERLLHTPHASDSAHYSVSAQDLRWRWEWDPLRGDPRFQALIARETPP
jgi:TolB-like protein